MSELYADLDSIGTAATNASSAAGYAGDMNVSDGLSGVSTAMQGGSSGSSATSAGTYMDDLAKKLSDGLTEYSEALTSAKNDYNNTDESASIAFTNFDSKMQ